MAYQVKDIDLQAVIKVRIKKVIEGKTYSGIVETTVGKIIFNDAIPQDLGFVVRDTNKPESMIALEIQEMVKKKQLSQIVEKCFKLKGATGTAEVLDLIKALGFKYSTIGAITTSVFDMKVPGQKAKILEDAEVEVVDIEKKFKRGLITEEERYNEVVEVLKKTTDRVETK